MKLKALLSALLIVALLCPAALMEEDISVAPEPEAPMEEVESTEGNEHAEGDQSADIEIDNVDLTVDEEASADFFDDEESILEEDDVDFIEDGSLDIDESASEMAYASQPLYGADENGNVALTSENFNDASFLTFVKQYDTNHDNQLSQEECDAVKEITIPEKVSEPTLKYFRKLERLTCHSTNLKYISYSEGFYSDLRGNLTSVDVSGCTNLSGIDIPFNQVEKLNIKGCTNLAGISVYCNNLTELDVSGLKLLAEVACENNKLKTLNVKGCTGLEWMDCGENQLTGLDISDCRNLQHLLLYDNKVTTLDVKGFSTLIELDISTNQFSSISLKGCTALDIVHCYGNSKLSTLDITDCAPIVNRTNLDLPSRHPRANEVIVFGPRYEGGFYTTYAIACDEGLTIIAGGKTVKVKMESSAAPSPATETSDDTPATQSVPAPAPAIPTIPAVKKAGKTTISAAPGSVYQLDLGGVSGKSFKSSKKKVAVVNGAGQVTIRGAGKTKITFKVGKKKRTVTLTVKDPTIPGSVAISPVNTAVKKGDVVTLTPVIPEGTTSGFKWKSSNKKVAKVVNGVVTFKKAGKVTITCTCARGKKKAKVTFRVSK